MIGATIDPAPASEPIELPPLDREVFDGIVANIALAQNLMPPPPPNYANSRACSAVPKDWRCTSAQ